MIDCLLAVEVQPQAGCAGTGAPDPRCHRQLKIGSSANLVKSSVVALSLNPGFSGGRPLRSVKFFRALGLVSRSISVIVLPLQAVLGGLQRHFAPNSTVVDNTGEAATRVGGSGRTGHGIDVLFVN